MSYDATYLAARTTMLNGCICAARRGAIRKRPIGASCGSARTDLRQCVEIQSRARRIHIGRLDRNTSGKYNDDEYNQAGGGREPHEAAVPRRWARTAMMAAARFVRLVCVCIFTDRAATCVVRCMIIRLHVAALHELGCRGAHRLMRSAGRCARRV